MQHNSERDRRDSFVVSHASLSLGECIETASSIEDLARAKKVDRTHVSRMLRLTSLAPEIVESVLAGEEVPGLKSAAGRNSAGVGGAAKVVGMKKPRLVRSGFGSYLI